MPLSIDAAHRVAVVLVEALPYIRRFRGQTIVPDGRRGLGRNSRRVVRRIRGGLWRASFARSGVGGRLRGP